MSKFRDIIQDLYIDLIKNTPRKTIFEAAKNVFNGEKLGFCFDYKQSLNRHFNIKEDFTLDNLTNDRKEAKEIYNCFKKEVISNMIQEELDVYNLYSSNGDVAGYAYDVDVLRPTTIFNNNKDKSFLVNTPFGNLTFKFTNRSDYGVKDDILLAYDDEKNEILIFENNVEKITTLDIINVLRRKQRFIHELTHYIDIMQDHFDNEATHDNDIEYLNNPNEFKANMQMIIYTFARYIFKNVSKIKQKYDLRKTDDIDSLFKEFLKDSISNVIDNEDLLIFRKEMFYLTDENKKTFFNELHKYILNDFDIDKPIEESYGKEYLLKLFRLEEQFWD